MYCATRTKRPKRPDKLILLGWDSETPGCFGLRAFCIGRVERFRSHLRIHTEAQLALVQVGSAREMDDLLAERGSPMVAVKVAIVEDDDILCFLLEEICRTAGCEVVGTARNVTDARALLMRRNADALILDFALDGEEDGLELLETARRDFPAMETILVTGWDHVKLQERIDFIAPDHMLKKPVMPQDLVAILRGLTPGTPHPALAHAA